MHVIGMFYLTFLANNVCPYKQNEVGQKIQFRSLAQDRDKKVNITTQPLKCFGC